ncbi:NAD(P)/FAD-dependent oxidoreductase [bacterium]|nr:NAD(P)/FAD-dependent oxidoreductase [bacterium]
MEKRLGETRAVVIGAGAGGLAAAIALAARGARVRVLERNPHPGGRLTPIEARGYRFDPAEPFINYPHVLGQLFALADLRLTDFLNFIPVRPTTRLVFPDGQTLDLWRDPHLLAKEVARFSKEDARRIPKFLAEMESFASVVEDHFWGTNGRGWRGPAFLAAHPRSVRHWRKLFSPFSLEHLLRRRFTHDRVRDIFRVLAMRPGGSPRGPAALAFLAGTEIRRGLWYPEGGMQAVLESLVRVATMLGVRFVWNARVENIEVEGDRVRRVSGQGFRPLRADLVVSTADPALTTGRLLSDGEPHKKLATRYRPRKARHSGLLVMLGCSEQFEALGQPETVFVGGNPFEEARQIEKWRVAPSDPTIFVSAPSLLDPSLAPESHHVLRLFAHQPPASNRFVWNEANADAERDRMLRRVEKAGAAGITESIQEEVVMTPPDFARTYGLTDGVLFGPSFSTRRGWMARPGTSVPEIGGLYLAGADTHPGPRLSDVITGGLLVASHAASKTKS